MGLDLRAPPRSGLVGLGICGLCKAAFTWGRLQGSCPDVLSEAPGLWIEGSEFGAVGFGSSGSGFKVSRYGVWSSRWSICVCSLVFQPTPTGSVYVIPSLTPGGLALRDPPPCCLVRFGIISTQEGQIRTTASRRGHTIGLNSDQVL